MLLMFPYRNHNNDHSSPLQRHDGRGGVEAPVSPSTVPQTSSSSPSPRRNRPAGAGMKAAGAAAAPTKKEPKISGKNNKKKKANKAREKELDDYASAEVANVAGRAGGKTPPRMTSVDDSTMLPEWCVPLLFSLFLFDWIGCFLGHFVTSRRTKQLNLIRLPNPLSHYRMHQVHSVG
jgi:hypothetical protein